MSIMVPISGSPYDLACRAGREPVGEPRLYRALEGFVGTLYVSDILPGLPWIDRSRELVSQGETRPGRRMA